MKPIGLLCLALLASPVVALAALQPEEIELEFLRGERPKIEALIAQDGGVKSDTAARFLGHAAAAGDLPLLERLLALGVPPDLVIQKGAGAGQNAVMWAAGNGCVPSIELLLRKGAKGNAIGSYYNASGGNSLAALRGAVASGSVEAVRSLLEAGADPNVMGGGVMVLADENGEIEMVQLLQAHGGRLPGPPASTVPARPGHSPAAWQDLGLATLLPAAEQMAPSPSGDGRCRLAVIADAPNLPAADLLTAKLSQYPNIHLVERQELDQILAERKLDRLFAIGAENAARVGTWLQADALVLIRTRQVAEQAVVETRFVRVVPGVMLDAEYSAAPLSDPAAWAARTAAKLPRLVEKSLSTNAIALAVLGVHRVVSQPADLGYEHTISVLLRAKLMRDPRFILLERTEMEKVVAENHQGTPFWTAGYVMDPELDLALDGSGEFRLTLRLQPALGHEPITVSAVGKKSSPWAVLDELLTLVHARIGDATPPPAFDTREEATRFHDEANWAMSAGFPQQASVAAEVAWGLGNRDSDLSRLRVRAAFSGVRELILRKDPTLASDWINQAAHGVNAWREGLHFEPLQNDTALQRQWLELFSEVADGMLQASLSISSASAQLRERAALTQLHDSFAGALRAAQDLARRQPPGSAMLALVSMVEARTVRVVFTDPDEQLAALRELFSRHFPQDDNSVRMNIRTAFHWTRASVTIPVSLQSGRGIDRHLPRNEPLERRFLAMLRAFNTPEDNFLAMAITVEPRHWIRSVADSSRVMEAFWAMRDLLASDGALFETYQEFFARAWGQEPSPEGKRIYRVRFPEGSGGQASPPEEITSRDFSRLLFLQLIARAPRSHPSFERLLLFSAYTREQIMELQTAIKHYAARTGLSLRSLHPRTRDGLMSLPAPPPPSPPAGVHVPTTVSTPAPSGTAVPLPITRFILPARIPRLHLLADSFHWADNRLWFLGSSLVGEMDPFKTYWHLFSYSPENAQVQRFDLPAGPESIGHDAHAHLTISPTHFIVDAKNAFLAVCDRSTMRWTQYPELKSSPTVRSLLAGDAFYLVTDQGKAFVRFDLKLRRAEVLASTQRHPGQSPLDQPSLGFNRVWKNEANEIAVAALVDPTNPPLSFVTVAAWAPDTKQWRLEETNRPKTTQNQPEPRTDAMQPAGKLIGASAPLPVGGGESFVQFRPLFPSSADRAAASALVLRIRDQPLGPIDLPITFALPDGLSLEPPRIGMTTLSIPIDRGFASPSIWVFPITNGPGFWVLPTRALETYLAAMRNRPAGAP